MKVYFKYTSVGLTVNFSSYSDFPITSPLYLKWDFGDGDSSRELNPVHTFSKSGFFSVRVRVLKGDDPQEFCFYEESILVSNKTTSTLPDTIYNLIDTYLPSSVFGFISTKVKKQYITKWQLYMGPLVNHHIPEEEYTNETYYEALENQLIMEMAAYDFMVYSFQNMINATAKAITDNNVLTSTSTGGSTSTADTGSAGQIKAIKTGPTEVEFFDAGSSESDSASVALKAMQPGGTIDILRQNICMLAERLSILLPICRRGPSRIVPPQVVNQRVEGPISGPDPKWPLDNPNPLWLLDDDIKV